MTAEELARLSDADYLGELQAYVAALTLTPVLYGLTAAQATAIGALTSTFGTELAQWNALQAPYTQQRIEKDAARKSLASEHSAQRAQVRAAPGVTDAQAAALGIDPIDTTRTPSPSPTTAPFGLIDYAKLTHTIRFRDSATPDKSGKPPGMLGCEIWMAKGPTAPTSEADYQFVALDTASPYEVRFQLADAGKKVWYLLRWVSKNGDKGPWSEAIEATINA